MDSDKKNSTFYNKNLPLGISSEEDFVLENRGPPPPLELYMKEGGGGGGTWGMGMGIVKSVIRVCFSALISDFGTLINNQLGNSYLASYCWCL